MMHINMWGVGFIIVGILLLINALFGFNIPIFRILLALLLLYAGASLLINPPRAHAHASYSRWNSQQVVFSKRYFKNEKIAETYQIVFGQGIIDLRTEKFEVPTNMDIAVTFGSGTLRLDPNTPTIVTGTATFGKIEFPDESTISMGTHVYRNYAEGVEPVLKIQVQVTFGNLEIEND